MGHNPPPPRPRPIREQSEEKLRATMRWRFSRHEHLRRRSYDACLELICRAEHELGLVEAPPLRVWNPRPPPKPSDARQSVTPVRS